LTNRSRSNSVNEMIHSPSESGIQMRDLGFISNENLNSKQTFNNNNNNNNNNTNNNNNNYNNINLGGGGRRNKTRRVQDSGKTEYKIRFV